MREGEGGGDKAKEFRGFYPPPPRPLPPEEGETIFLDER
jgi:hypothetical protein